MAARLRNRMGLAMVVAFAACAPAADGAGGDRSGAPEPAHVRVENDGYADVNVFVLHSGTRWRLGTVTGNTRQTFRLPHQLARNTRQVRLLADPIGGVTPFVSESVTLTPGADVSLRVNAALQMSTVAVW